MQTRTVWNLARLAECSDPGTLESAGAVFLRNVEDAALEALEDFDGDETDWNDAAHELADSAVPIYTREVWATFTDLAAWSEDPSLLGAETLDMERAAMICLYMIAERLVNALFAEVQEERTETARELGAEHGRARATWATDGNTETTVYGRIIRGYEDGDPEIMEMSERVWGEWAGESEREVFGHTPSDDERNAYEEAYTEAFWEELLPTCLRMHECEWGPMETSRFAGTFHQKCTVPGCREVNAYADDDEED